MAKDDDFQGVTFIDCEANDNEGDGFHFGKGTNVRGKGLKAARNKGRGIVTEGDNRLNENKLARAIKKLSTNNKGWKIMVVGTLLAALLGIPALAVYDYYVKPSLSKTLIQQPQMEAKEEPK